MAITLPSQASYDWDTEHSLALENVYDQLLDPHKLATPTARIFWANKMEGELGPDEKFQLPIITKHYSPSVASKNYRFPTDDIDNITMQEWSPVRMANGAGTNDVDWAHYKTNYARFNHIDIKVDSVHRGLTDALNYLMWYNWDTTAISGQQIDINSQLTSLTTPPEELYVKNITAVTELPYSIPMLTRKTVTGHTIGNIAVTTTSNYFWQVTNTDASGATITRATTGNNIDAVTAIDSTTCKELTLDDVFEHLDAISEGWQYDWYAACPPSLYRQLRNLITAMNIRNSDSPLAELGIKASIEASEYQCVFYQEPILRALWPNSIWFYDPTAIYWKFDSAFAPRVYPWERIPGTNMYGTAVYLNFQMVRPDAKGVSAMHGYKAS